MQRVLQSDLDNVLGKGCVRCGHARQGKEAFARNVGPLVNSPEDGEIDMGSVQSVDRAYRLNPKAKTGVGLKETG